MLTRLLRVYVDRQTIASLYNFFTLILKTIKSVFRFLPMSQLNTPDPPQHNSAVDPPPFDPSQPSIPISYPIKTLQDLRSRAYFSSFHYPFNKSSVPLSPPFLDLPNRPRLLVCHDLQGGYGDDKWVQGWTNPDAYAIWHWHLIDVFVYFSHSLVTLPPPSWTNAAHRHGVKVLGTFITEWDEGRLVCNELLETKESAQMYAERLAELAVALGFDGWLINMENKLDVGQIPNLRGFVSHLTKTMHSLLHGSLVIWYDSVTINGDLKWQDQLNDNNKPFFDICDGIFVNYTWKKDYPKISASVAGNRKFDVYMGVDVFGRNTFGGGQWNANVALDVIKDENISAALFAPAWVYETKQPPDFQTTQKGWWALVEKSWGRAKNYPKVLPFYSNFDQGHGYHIYVEGGLVKENPWNNLSCQSFQPLLEFIDGPTPDAIQVLVDFKEASYNGGGNITFKGTLEPDSYFITKLFQGELPLGNLPVQVRYSVKSDENAILGLSILFSSIMNERKTSVLIAPRKMDQFSTKFSDVIMAHQVREPEMDAGWVIHEGRISMEGHILTEINAVCYKLEPEHGELRSDHRAEDGGKALAYSPTSKRYFAVLGDIAIKHANEHLYLPPSVSWLVEGECINCSSVSQGLRTINLKITWKLKDGNDFLFPKYNIYVQKLSKQEHFPGERLEGTAEYLGAAHVEAYYVSDLSVPSETSSLKFIIEVCSIDGACQKLSDCPYFWLDLGGQ